MVGMIAAFALAATVSAQPADLQRINSEVNASITFQAEPAGRDVWQLAPATGDCEDYALTKLTKLNEQGVTGRIAVIRYAAEQRGRITMPSRYHAVLIVDGLVLDNVTTEIKTLSAYLSAGHKLVCYVSDTAEGERRGGALSRCEP